MKTGKIIKKNIKLLLRSRVSTLVLILGPLLVILLVGISFSTSSFNLNIGVYSEQYSELSRSFINKLKAENFKISEYLSQELCIQSVKDGQSHACIVFPANMEIENEKTNIIKFYVDQSKINLVYLVMSTLSTSFGERSQEISTELTRQIITTLFDTKTNLEEAETLTSDIQNENSNILKNAKSSINKLNSLDLSSGSKVNVDLAVSDIRSDLDNLLDSTLEIVDDALDSVDDLKNYGGLDSNQSNYLDDIEDSLKDINSTLSSKHNLTLESLNKMVNDINDALEDMSEKLDTVSNVNSEVLKKLKSLKDDSEKLEEKSEDLLTEIKQMIYDIEKIEITNPENIVSPIKTEINTVVKSQTNLGFLFPSLIVILIMFIGLLLPSTLIIMEKNSRAYFRTFLTPTKEWLFVLATFLSSIILLSLQIIIIFLVSQFYFKINFTQSSSIMLLSLMTIMTFFTLLGMLIGYLFNTEELSLLASVSIGTLFLLTSGIIFPIESMPSYIIEKARFNPVVLASEMFKKSLLFGANLSSIKFALKYLLIFSFVILVLIYIIKKSKRIQILLKKPGQIKAKKDWLRNQFDFGERKAKNLPEFIVSIQNLSDERFTALLEQNSFRDWIHFVYGSRYLAKKIENIKSKEELIKVLVEELKKISQDKK